ncbi:hypothetical protein [Sorangium sp. So ce1078]|uniref:hypothetical protein n=1 Tax=Sorangium sp. So ce1078 TaxID=3133329 RepID=UPI003F62D190
MLAPLTETERAMVADRPDIATTIGVTARDVNTTTLTSSNTIDGILELEGELGSMRRVRVFKNEEEITADVAVTASGAHPTKLELPQAPRESAPTAQPPAPTPSPAPSRSWAPKRAPEPSPLVPPKFE